MLRALSKGPAWGPTPETSDWQQIPSSLAQQWGDVPWATGEGPGLDGAVMLVASSLCQASESFLVEGGTWTREVLRPLLPFEVSTEISDLRVMRWTDNTHVKMLFDPPVLVPLLWPPGSHVFRCLRL